MEVLKVIGERRSIRKYKKESIPDGDLKKILEAARLAPSAGNRQPWRFVVVRDHKKRKKVAEVARGQTWVADAGVVVAALGDYSNSLGRYAKWVDRDVMTSVEHMVLAAKSLGYGTYWIGAFEEDEVKEILSIPREIKVVALLPIGVPDEYPAPKSRKRFSEIFYDEEYSKSLML